MSSEQAQRDVAPGPEPRSSKYPQGQGSGGGRRGGRAGMLFALALIVLGGALLVGNLGLVTINWLEALRYWPVLLILLGLDILIGRRSALGSGLMALITLAALGGVLWIASRTPASATPPPFGFSAPATGHIEQPQGAAKSLKVTIKLSSMALTLGAQPGSDFAAQGDWSTDQGPSPTIGYQVQGDVGVLNISQPEGQLSFPFLFGRRSQMTLNLPRNIPVDIVVDNGLGEASLDLTNLAARSLDAKANAGSISVTLPGAGQMAGVKVRGELGSVSVAAPDKATLNMDSLDVSASSGSLDLTLPAEGTIGALTVKGDLGSVSVSIADDSTLQIGPLDISSGSGSLSVSLPSQGVIGTARIKGDLGSVTVDIPGQKNTLSAESFDVTGGSGSVSVTLPARGTYQANIQGDLGSITVTLPAGLEAHVDIKASLPSPDVSSTRLKSAGSNAWETANYKEGDHRALVSIKAGSGGVTVEDQ